VGGYRTRPFVLHLTIAIASFDIFCRFGVGEGCGLLLRSNVRGVLVTDRNRVGQGLRCTDLEVGGRGFRRDATETMSRSKAHQSKDESTRNM
jgi:hypothetical protein